MIPVLRGYAEFDDIPEDRPITAYSLNEIATEKVVALQDRARNEPRDLYDLWFLTSRTDIQIGISSEQSRISSTSGERKLQVLKIALLRKRRGLGCFGIAASGFRWKPFRSTMRYSAPSVASFVRQTSPNSVRASPACAHANPRLECGLFLQMEPEVERSEFPTSLLT